MIYGIGILQLTVSECLRCCTCCGGYAMPIESLRRKTDRFIVQIIQTDNSVNESVPYVTRHSLEPERFSLTVQKIIYIAPKYSDYIG